MTELPAFDGKKVFESIRAATVNTWTWQVRRIKKKDALRKQILFFLKFFNIKASVATNLKEQLAMIQNTGEWKSKAWQKFWIAKENHLYKKHF